MTTTDHPTAPGPGGPERPGSAPVDELDAAGLEAWPDDVPPDQDDTWYRFRDDERGARRAELRIVACWSVTAVCALGLMVTYVLGGQPQVEGLLLFGAFGGLGVGFALWARDLLPGHDITAPREQHANSESIRVALVESFERGGGAMARRPFLLKVLLPVGGLFGLSFVFPLASLGPRPHTLFDHTAWRPGDRLVMDDGTPIKLGDVPVNGLVTVFPEGVTDENDKAAAQTVLLNLGTADFNPAPNQASWSPIDNGNRYVAFSKVCTHAGCPVSLYNRATYQLVCPCHQSTFDVLTRCNPVFGPASRSLPQLPVSVNQNGYLIATNDYDQPVGPGFWNRG